MYTIRELQQWEEIDLWLGLGGREYDGGRRSDNDDNAVGVVARAERQPDIGVRVRVHVLTWRRVIAIIPALIY